MGDRETEILEIPDIPHLVWEDNASSTYETPLGSDHSMAGTSPDDPSQFLGYMHAHHRYWSHSLNHETHHAPTRTITIRYGMPDLTEIGPAPHVGSGVDPSVMPGGTSIPFHVERFGSTSHITPSIPAVEVPSHTHPRPSTSVPIWGPEPRQVNIGGMSYIPSHVPSSLTPPIQMIF